MDEMTAQVRAWADAVARTTEDRPVLADDVTGADRRTGGDRRSTGRGSRVVIVGAVLAVLVGATAVVLAGRGSDDASSVRTAGSDPRSQAVPYRVLDQVPFTGDPAGAVHVVGTEAGYRALWAALVPDRVAAPPAHLGSEVVVAMTVLDRTCALRLEGFERTGATVTAQFHQPDGGCERAPVPTTFFVSVQREAIAAADSAEGIDLVLPRQSPEDVGSTHVQVGGAVPGVFLSSWLVLEADTVPAGSTVDGTVQVVNDTGETLRSGTCGPFFGAELRDEAGSYGGLRAMCLQHFALPPGVSGYPVTVRASYGGCSNAEPFGPTSPACRPGGGIPPLPAGEYEAVVTQASELAPTPLDPPAPVAITVR